MSDILNRPSVLVLNRNWQAINTRTPAEAFCQLVTHVATALDISEDSMNPVQWKDWLLLPIREHDQVIHTATRAIRIPTVIVLATYAKVPKKRPTFNSRALWNRDGGVCQYTGRKLAHGEGNIDHVVPRSRGGATSFENCVIACKEVNARKADRRPEEVGLKLIRQPVAPRELPVTALIKNPGIPDWRHFLVHS